MRNVTKLYLAALAVPALLLAGCSSSDSPSDASSGGAFTPVNAGSLTVCSNPPFEPFETTTTDGTIDGFDIALVGEVAKDLGLTVQAIATPFDAIESGTALETGKCDILASGISITPERKEKFAFSDPYYDSYLGLLVPATSTAKTLDDLKTVGVQQATTGETYAKDHGAETVQFEDVGLQTQAVQNGKVDGALNDLAVMKAFAEGNSDVKVAAEIPSGESFGLGVKLTNTDLLTQVNTTLTRIKGDSTYDALYLKWFGTAPVKAS